MTGHAYAVTAPLKSPEYRECPGGWMNPWGLGRVVGHRRGTEAPPFPSPCPTPLFHLTLPKLLPFVINQRSSKSNVSLSEGPLQIS